MQQLQNSQHGVRARHAWPLILVRQQNQQLLQNSQHIAYDESRTYPATITVRQHNNQANLSDAATAKQSAWSESRAYLAVITVGQQDHQAGLSEPLGLSTGQELVKHNLHHQR